MTLILRRKCYQFKNLFSKNLPIFSAPNFSAAIDTQPYITPEANPVNHTVNDIGLFYCIKNSLALETLFKFPIISPQSLEEYKTFGETALIVRKPALEIINCLKNTDFEKPVNRYVLYGKYGNGKTTTLLHLIHYAYMSDWLIVHVPSVINWGYAKTERCESSTMEGLIDTPTLGSEWLMQFKTQNLKILKKLDLKLQKDYRWNIQEKNDAGEPLLNLIDHGITRGRYSCNVINSLLEEIKLISKSGQVKTLVVIDGYNLIFHPAKKAKNRKIKNLAPAKISCMVGFKNIVRPDWHNGAVVLTCYGNPKTNSTVDHLPLNQLTTSGFEFLDPFIPIEVPSLTKQEIRNFLNYYKSKKWLLNSEGDKELEFLCGGNAYMLKKLCGPL